MVKVQTDLDVMERESKKDIEILFSVLADLSELMLTIPVGTHKVLKEEDVVAKATQNFKYTPNEFIKTIETVFNKHKQDNNLSHTFGTELCIYSTMNNVCIFTFEYEEDVQATKEMKIYHTRDTDKDNIEEIKNSVFPDDINFLFFEAVSNQLLAEHIAKYGI